MALIEIQNLSFAYNGAKNKALDGVSLTVEKGDFVLLCGASGCGKTTLLRLLKPLIAPCGTSRGTVLFDGVPTEQLDMRSGVSQIGFVMQNPDAQIVTDKVWHELAFCAESLGMTTGEIRAKVAEVCGVLGIADLFDKRTCELSGGQKQLVNLASVLVADPKVLLLDEPTAQLDPVAAEDFLTKLRKLNEEQGVTVVLVEHRLEQAFSLANKVAVMQEGTIVACAAPTEIASLYLQKKLDADILLGLPSSVRLFAMTNGGGNCPINVRDGRKYVNDNFCATGELAENVDETAMQTEESNRNKNVALSVEGGYFRYQRTSPDVLNGLNLDVYDNEILAVFGANGAGKTTLLRVLAASLRMYKGKYRLFGKKIKEFGDKLYRGNLTLLTQNPQDLFVANTVEEELSELAVIIYRDKNTAAEKAAEVAKAVGIEHLFGQHPYDLSGGEQQRLALGKVLLTDPKILLLDEPTKGLDAYAKSQFAGLLSALKSQGKTIVLVTHDVEFASVVADRCAMFFDGKITTVLKNREFFVANTYYTTAARRLTKDLLTDAVTVDEAAKILVRNRRAQSEVLR